MARSAVHVESPVLCGEAPGRETNILPLGVIGGEAPYILPLGVIGGEAPYIRTDPSVALAAAIWEAIGEYGEDSLRNEAYRRILPEYMRFVVDATAALERDAVDRIVSEALPKPDACQILRALREIDLEIYYAAVRARGFREMVAADELEIRPCQHRAENRAGVPLIYTDTGFDRLVALNIRITEEMEERLSQGTPDSDRTELKGDEPIAVDVVGIAKKMKKA